MLDAGDLFVAGFRVDEAKRAETLATARFIVDQYNVIGCDGITLGDRDLALGLDELKRLEKRAKFPFLAANLVNADSGKPIFSDHVVKTVAGVRIGIFGLAAAQARGTPAAPWKVLPAEAAARAQIVALKSAGAQVIVALAHLDDPIMKDLAKKVPGITAMLGGASVLMTTHPEEAAGTYLANGFSKGKYLSTLSLHIQRGSAPGRFVDRYKRKGLEKRFADVRARKQRYEQLVERRKAEDAAAPAPQTVAGAPKRPVRSNTKFFEDQVVKLRAEEQLIAMELDGAEAIDPKANFIRYEMIPLSRTLVHDEKIEAAVQRFRKKYPAPGAHGAAGTHSPGPTKPGPRAGAGPRRALSGKRGPVPRRLPMPRPQPIKKAP